MKTFVVYTASRNAPPEPMFAFHARDSREAESMKIGWARYQEMLPSEFGVEESPTFRVSNVCMRDDYVYHRRRTLCFFSLRHAGDEHPYVVECHVTTKPPSHDQLLSLLREVAAQQFNGRPYKVWTEAQSTNLDVKPLHGLAAEDLETGVFIVPVLRD